MSRLSVFLYLLWIVVMMVNVSLCQATDEDDIILADQYGQTLLRIPVGLPDGSVYPSSIPINYNGNYYWFWIFINDIQDGCNGCYGCYGCNYNGPSQEYFYIAGVFGGSYINSSYQPGEPGTSNNNYYTSGDYNGSELNPNTAIGSYLLYYDISDPSEFELNIIYGSYQNPDIVVNIAIYFDSSTIPNNPLTILADQYGQTLYLPLGYPNGSLASSALFIEPTCISSPYWLWVYIHDQNDTCYECNYDGPSKESFYISSVEGGSYINSSFAPGNTSDYVSGNYNGSASSPNTAIGSYLFYFDVCDSCSFGLVVSYASSQFPTETVFLRIYPLSTTNDIVPNPCLWCPFSCPSSFPSATICPYPTPNPSNPIGCLLYDISTTSNMTYPSALAMIRSHNLILS